MAKKITAKDFEKKTHGMSYGERTDFIKRHKKNFITDNNKSMMRVNKNLLKEIAEIKLVKQESYASVVKRLVDGARKRRMKGEMF